MAQLYGSNKDADEDCNYKIILSSRTSEGARKTKSKERVRRDGEKPTAKPRRQRQ